MESKLAALSGEPKKRLIEPVDRENRESILSKSIYDRQDDLLWGELYIPVKKPRQEIFDRVGEYLDELKTENDKYIRITVTCNSYCKSHIDLPI